MTLFDDNNGDGGSGGVAVPIVVDHATVHAPLEPIESALDDAPVHLVGNDHGDLVTVVSLAHALDELDHLGHREPVDVTAAQGDEVLVRIVVRAVVGEG